jgi:hypothetical protein
VHAVCAVDGEGCETKDEQINREKDPLTVLFRSLPDAVGVRADIPEEHCHID